MECQGNCRPGMIGQSLIKTGGREILKKLEMDDDREREKERDRLRRRVIEENDNW